MNLARPATRPVIHAGRRLLRSHLHLMVWFWSIAVAAVVAITAVLAGFDITNLSVVSFARQAGVWMPFSLQIVVTTTYLRVHVAGGLTRRTFTAVALGVATVIALVNAAAMATALTGERLVHGWLGWDWEFQDAAFDPTGSSWAVGFLDYGLTFLVGNFSGLLVGVVYHAAGATWGSRAGAWVGTLALPVTCGPLLLVLGIVAVQGADHPSGIVGSLGSSVGTAATVALALAAATAFAFTLVARRTAIARPRT